MKNLKYRITRSFTATGYVKRNRTYKEIIGFDSHGETLVRVLDYTYIAVAYVSKENMPELGIIMKYYFQGSLKDCVLFHKLLKNKPPEFYRVFREVKSESEPEYLAVTFEKV